MSKVVLVGDEAITKMATILHSIPNDFTEETIDTVKGVVAGLLASVENPEYVPVERQDLLSLVSVAGDYGFYNDVLLDAIAGWLGPVKREEIETYARNLADSDGYDEEDYENAKETLLGDRYITVT